MCLSHEWATVSEGLSIHEHLWEIGSHKTQNAAEVGRKN